MRREVAAWLVIVVALLVGGLLLGRRLPADVPADEPNRHPTDAAFREWFWDRRALDLVAQAGLIFAGALGVAAILPGNEDLPPPGPDPHRYPESSP